MFISELTDLNFTREAYMLLAQCSVGESRKRAQELLAIALEEIRIKSLLQASAEK